MKIAEGIEARGKALWLNKSKTLVIADLHIGYEEALNKQGVLVPRMMFDEMKKEIEELLKLKPKIIVVNGDLKHEFGEISKQEWFETLDILDILMKKAKVVLVKGNHDTILGPIAKKKGLKIKDYYIIGNICILHGDKIIENGDVKKSKVIIIGHEHPAVSIREGVKSEVYKCFLVGKWKNKKLIVMPSFFSVFEGSDVKKEKLLSPYLHDIKNFDVYVLGDKLYWFGKLKNIR